MAITPTDSQNGVWANAASMPPTMSQNPMVFCLTALAWMSMTIEDTR